MPEDVGDVLDEKHRCGRDRRSEPRTRWYSMKPI